jgi:hypothetical protein
MSPERSRSEKENGDGQASKITFFINNSNLKN